MHTIAVIAFDGISPFHLSVPCIVFGDDLLKLGVQRYRLLICGERRGRIATMSGFDIEVKHGLGSLKQADTIIVPAWRTPSERPPEAVLRALQQAHARGSRIVGLCLGTFVLAAAGLLDGRTASTHWAWADEFEHAYPGVTLDRHAIYVDEGDVLTSAGTAAAIDCCLHLVRRDLGADVANRIARRLVVAPQRHGDQAQYIENPVHKDDAPDALSKTLEWAIAHLRPTAWRRTTGRSRGHEPAHVQPTLPQEDGNYRYFLAASPSSRCRAATAGNQPSFDRPDRRGCGLRLDRVIPPTLHAHVFDLTGQLSATVPCTARTLALMA
ncbi:AraC family transcriptional regulator [Dyella terrae]|uniref:AraC family transcriptional regulator n=1 Tax=Dyella terrae TaxID=522259 RepID=UPI003D18826F|nr:DJ-1/PfpI family protein [Dyella terrae]